MDKDSIAEFLEKRHKELEQDSFLPPIKPKETEVKPQEQVAPKEKNSIPWKKFSKIFVFSFVVLTLIFAGVETYKNYSKIKSGKPENILASVAKLTEIPINENPTIATVTNSELIKKQTFFKEALIGDKVLIFNTSKKAILYRPSTNKIISIAPLN
jgi:hypothetical protein